MRPRITLRFYVLVLCTVYFGMLYVFYGRLQLEMGGESQSTMARLLAPTNTRPVALYVNRQQGDIQRKVLETNIIDAIKIKRNNSGGTVENKNSVADEGLGHKNKRENSGIFNQNCFLPANYSERVFLPLHADSFIYSAYLDEREGKAIIRIMSIHSSNKKVRAGITVLCHFAKAGVSIAQKATFYEMCENHAKRYGGFILSCDVPDGVDSVCQVNVSIVTNSYPQKSDMVTINVTKLHAKSFNYFKPVSKSVPDKPGETANEVTMTKDIITDPVPYNFSICVPPLFGNIDTIKFVEFIELNALLGVQHFIFYISAVSNLEVLNVLDYYQKLHMVTLIQWKLPSNIQPQQIWYNGQLNAHNDCLYRAMSLTKYLAIIDIDEFIVPHDGTAHLQDSVEHLFTDGVCGLSFSSAFYDPKYSDKSKSSKLLTINRNGRSAVFSSIRTKVMVRPAQIFEVGIHHISKPALERYKVASVNTGKAFLHHYRVCLPNYGMRCSVSIKDNTIWKYEKALTANVQTVMEEALSGDVTYKISLVP